MNTAESPETRKPQPDKLAKVMLPHHFTKDERLELSVRQNQMFGQIGSIEAEARKAAAAYAAKVNALKVNIEALRLLLQAGCEPRERSVIITFDPSAGIKTYYDASDTGKTTPLGIHKMEPDDYVLDLPL